MNYMNCGTLPRCNPSRDALLHEIVQIQMVCCVKEEHRAQRLLELVTCAAGVSQWASNLASQQSYNFTRLAGCRVAAAN